MAEEPFTSVETEPEAVVNSTVEAGFETEQTAIPEATTKEKISYGEVKRQKRQKEDKVTRKIVFFVVSALVIVGLVLGLTFWSYVQSGLKPLDTDNKQLVQVEIPSGSSNKEIGEILENDKVIKSGMVFHFYTKFNNLTDFQAGYYQMAPNMSLDDISQLLQSGGTAEPVDIADAKITIPEGYDISQIASSIEEATTKKIKAADVKALMNDDAFFQEMLGKYPQLLTSVSQAEGLRYRLEGYLFPATYDYYAATSTLKGLVEQMIAKSDAVLQSYYEQIQNQGYTVQEVLTLASLVEKEGVEDADRRKIAQVFLNRLAQQMPLQSDISILYALDTHKEFVTLEDLEVDSPYNLYKNQGYGPGPFNNPSENAIQAVLNPEPNDYLYFVADVETGQVYFTGTYEEHMELVEKYVDNKKNE
ncbi:MULTISPECIES: endolytic transglycosylase MltG [unclassified Enterococcus]|uniref:endolytic transglycosylase MltG n=1 Tax=unclassified Enterococcus TaxID=2608891 RepID=UPI0024734482|nr:MULTISPECIES: endolytic transglycosylase MltG [unclassified Enterococcus]